jgi:hypothetical protein
MKTATALELAYRVTITRGDNDDGPPLVTGQHSYHVTEVSVLAEWDDGAGGWRVRSVDVRAARRIRNDGTLGAAIGPFISYRGNPGAPAAEQARAFRQAAADAAEAAHAAWLPRHLAAISAGLPPATPPAAAGGSSR